MARRLKTFLLAKSAPLEEAPFVPSDQCSEEEELPFDTHNQYAQISPIISHELRQPTGRDEGDLVAASAALKPVDTMQPVFTDLGIVRIREQP